MWYSVIGEVEDSINTALILNLLKQHDNDRATRKQAFCSDRGQMREPRT